MEIEVAVPEVDAGLAVPGRTLVERNQRLDASVVVSAIPGREFSASISEFSTAADPVTHTYSLTFVFETPDDVSVLAGMSAHVQLDVKAREGQDLGFRVPVQSVAGDDRSNPYVWIIGDGMKAAKRPVEVGEIAGSMIEIMEGVGEGDRIALTGVHHLREGLSVREWGAE